MTWIIIQAFLTKYKTPLLCVAAVGCVTGAFFTGRSSAPVKTVEVTKTVEVEKKVVETQVQIVEKRIYVKDEARDVHRETVTVQQPDGTVTTTEVVDDKTKTKETDDQSSSMASSTFTSEEKLKSSETLKIVDNRKPDWHLQVRGGAGALIQSPLSITGDVGIGVERRIVGPFFLGAYGNVQFDTKAARGFAAGVSVGLEF